MEIGGAKDAANVGDANDATVMGGAASDATDVASDATEFERFGFSVDFLCCCRAVAHGADVESFGLCEFGLVEFGSAERAAAA